MTDNEITKSEAQEILSEVTATVVAAPPAPVVYLLGRDAILNAKDLKHEDVLVAEWGGTVRVRGLKGTERDEFEQSIVVQDGDGKSHVESKAMRARLCSLTIVNESGTRLFTEDDVADLGGKSAAALERVFDVAMRLAGMSKDEVEKMTQDLKVTPNDASSSDSL